jgi:ribosomal protein L29
MNCIELKLQLLCLEFEKAYDQLDKNFLLRKSSFVNEKISSFVY